jgi:Tol biopolymer transport system component
VSSGIEPAALTRTSDYLETTVPVRRVHIALGLAAIAALIGLVAVSLRRAPVALDPHVYRGSILTATLSGDPAARFAVSPDGHQLAFVAADAQGRAMLWLRPLDGLEAQPVAGTEGAAGPFWSPDERFVAFSSGDALKKVALPGGTVLTVCDKCVGLPGGSWSRDDTILFSGATGALSRIPAAGGSAVQATALDAKAGETRHAFPSFLPDGRHFLYAAAAGDADRAAYVGALGSTVRSLIIDHSGNLQYAQGHVVFVRDDVLMAQRFDEARLVLSGEPLVLARSVQTKGTGVRSGAFSVSQTGALAYQSVRRMSQLVWRDRTGSSIGVAGDPGAYGDIKLSPDGSRAAVTVLAGAEGPAGIWILDFARGSRSRFTSDAVEDVAPIWSADGSTILFGSRRKGRIDLYQKTAAGAGAESPLYADGLDKAPLSWSLDNRFILYSAGLGAERQMWLLPLFGDRRPSPFTSTRIQQLSGQFSADQRMLAYDSAESGRPEIYVSLFGRERGKWQISTSGGRYPRWRSDGKELFYLTPDNQLMSVRLQPREGGLEVGETRPLFDTRPASSAQWSVYDVVPDGQRFLVNEVAEDRPLPLTLVVNWTAADKK